LGWLVVVLAAGASCAVVPQPFIPHPDDDVAMQPNGRRSVPASQVAGSRLAVVRAVAQRARYGTKRETAVAHAQLSTRGGSINLRSARVKRVARLVERSGTVVAERLETSVAD
jgi:hypothetical protein